MYKLKELIIPGTHQKPIALDIFYKNKQPNPLIVYAHGFNGFKDWGAFDLIAEAFSQAGFCFIKFNFSHNGTTVAQPDEFADAEAYGHNNYTIELNDLQLVIDWALREDNPHSAAINNQKLYLLGHSRGGGVVLLKAAEEKRVAAVAAWASVANCKTPWGQWTDEKMQHWKKTGVEYYHNSRTGQQLPLYYQLYQDYEQHTERLNIEKAVASLKRPLLLCHGTNDEAVPVVKAHLLKEFAPNAELFTVDSDHVFGRKHPWRETHLPPAMQAVLDRTIRFFESLT